MVPPASDVWMSADAEIAHTENRFIRDWGRGGKSAQSACIQPERAHVDRRAKAGESDQS